MCSLSEQQERLILWYCIANSVSVVPKCGEKDSDMMIPNPFINSTFQFPFTTNNWQSRGSVFGKKVQFSPTGSHFPLFWMGWINLFKIRQVRNDPVIEENEVRIPANKRKYFSFFFHTRYTIARLFSCSNFFSEIIEYIKLSLLFWILFFSFPQVCGSTSEMVAIFLNWWPAPPAILPRIECCLSFGDIWRQFPLVHLLLQWNLWMHFPPVTLLKKSFPVRCCRLRSCLKGLKNNNNNNNNKNSSKKHLINPSHVVSPNQDPKIKYWKMQSNTLCKGQSK